MPTDRWHRLEQLFSDAVAQPASLRADFLTRTCGPDARMRDEIASLLTAVEQSGDFLSTPALDVFARQISREGGLFSPATGSAHHVERRLQAAWARCGGRATSESTRPGRSLSPHPALPGAVRVSGRASRRHAQSH
jgi:hypothetical protein